MNTIAVNNSKCTACGMCVEICPIQILIMNEKESIPEFVEKGSEVCINCGHCFAVCPEEAITLSGFSPENALLIDYSMLPDAKQLELLIKGRRSIRTYNGKSVEKEAIEKLIDFARYAPTGLNRQPVNWAVLMGKEKVLSLTGLVVEWMRELIAASNPMAESLNFQRLVSNWEDGRDSICRGAPVIVIAYGIKDDPMVPQSCTIAATYLELAAFGLGLGACWAGYLNLAMNMSEKVRKFIGLSGRSTTGAVMMIGYPEHNYSRIPQRNTPKVLWR